MENNFVAFGIFEVCKHPLLDMTYSELEDATKIEVETNPFKLTISKDKAHSCQQHGKHFEEVSFLDGLATRKEASFNVLEDIVLSIEAHHKSPQSSPLL